MRAERVGNVVLTRLKNLNFPRPKMATEPPRDSSDFGIEVHRLFDEALESMNALDFDSLISRTYRLFQEQESIRGLYQTIFPYIFVDEFQDTTYAQYALLGYLVRRPGRQVFVVADDDQTIYGWNGASALRVRQFIDDYAPKVIELTYSYRAPPEVISLANALIRNNAGRGAERGGMEPSEGRSGDEVVRAFWGFQNERDEFEAIIAELKTRHQDHLGSVLILGRTRSLLGSFKEAIDRAGLPASLRERKDEFRSSLMGMFEWTLHAAATQDDPVALSEFARRVSTFFELSPPIVGATNLDGILHTIDDDTTLRSGDLSLKAFASLIRTVLISGVKPETLVSETVRLGSVPSLSALCRNDESVELLKEEIAVWRSICSSIRATAGELPDLAAFSQEMVMHSKEQLRTAGAVTLMTVHGAKGLEADHVYVVGLSEDEFPLYTSLRPDASPELVEEERRLCFVAITRAKKSLTLTGAKSYRGYDKIPSRFLGEMGL
jgi:DNA helicase-2/ATP-dependent DNA helicase PcrA